MLKNLRKPENRRILIVTALLVVAFAFLASLFPYSGDDWAWGSEVGLNRLKNRFADYNGRYAGNLLILLLSRDNIARCISISFSLVCICLFPLIYCKSPRITIYLLSIMLCLLMPAEIFTQSIAWTSGFSNYVPSILLVMVYLLIIKNIFSEQKPAYRRGIPILAFLIGFFAALFMENITLYNVALSALIIVFVYLRHRCVKLTHAAHFMGSIAGCALMFSNSAYRNIAGGNDPYRSTVIDHGILKTVFDNTEIIFVEFFQKNWLALMVFSLLIAATCVLYICSNSAKKGRRLRVFLLTLHGISLILICIKSGFPGLVLAAGLGRTVSKVLTLFVFTVAAVLYFLSAALLLWLCIQDREDKCKVMLLLISIPIIIAPLVVVNPVSARCFFAAYFMQSSACVLLLDYVLRQMKVSKNLKLCISSGLAVTCIAVFIFMLTIYIPEHAYDNKRNHYMRKQIQMGYDEITLCSLPYEHTRNTLLSADLIQERFKLFHNIEADVSIRVIEHDEFDQWAEKFDQKTAEH